MSSIPSHKQYRRTRRYKRALLVLGVILLVVIAIISISIGSASIPYGQVVEILFGGGREPYTTIVWSIRIPRVLGAIVAGLGLSVAGAVMQSMLRNPLGSPFTLGISHAAAFGAAFAITVLNAGTLEASLQAFSLHNPYIVTVSAFFWSLGATVVLLLIARLREASPETLVLAGVALGSLFTAGNTALQYFASSKELSSIVFWTFGNMSKATWRNVGIMSLVVLPVAVYFGLRSWTYSILDQGTEIAKSLGVNVERTRLIAMGLSSLITAVIVSFVGIIGFVGLVIPHIVRKLAGTDEKYLIPLSCVAGSILLVGSDTMARTIISPIVLPVGILTSFLGAPLFLYLILRGREYW